jgi:ABC-type sugar transport system substrate-binding protein
VPNLGLVGHLQQQRDELRLGDHYPVGRVAEQVGDLFGGGGVVDRERRRAKVQRGGVAEVELRAVDHHQRDRVAGFDAEVGKAGGDPADALGVLPPGDGDRVPLGAQGHLVGQPRGGVLECLAQRRHRLLLPDG